MGSYKKPIDKDFAFSDAWYTWKGVKPPTHDVHEMTEDDLREKTAELARNHICNWTQRGNMIHCDSGAFEHGKIISIHKRLVRSENGVPIFADIVITKQ